MPSIIRTWDGQVECGRWCGGEGRDRSKRDWVHDVAGISNEALGVWFRFREMMAGSGSVQGCQVGGWCVRAQLPPSLWSSRAPASVACE